MSSHLFHCLEVGNHLLQSKVEPLLFPSCREFSIRRIFHVYLSVVVQVAVWHTSQQLITEHH